MSCAIRVVHLSHFVSTIVSYQVLATFNYLESVVIDLLVDIKRLDIASPRPQIKLIRGALIKIVLVIFVDTFSTDNRLIIIT